MRMIGKRNENKGMLKASLMIDLLFYILAVAAIYGMIFKINEAKVKSDSRDEAVSHFVTLISKFVYDRTSGYSSDKGGTCSSDYSVKDISAYRIKECAGIAGYDLVELGTASVDRLDGEKSYFGFLKKYAVDNTAPLKIYIDDVNDYEIKVLVVATTDDKGQIEQKFGAIAQSALAPYFVGAYYNATSLSDTAFLGNSTDGIIRLHFKY